MIATANRMARNRNKPLNGTETKTTEKKSDNIRVDAEVAHKLSVVATMLKTTVGAIVNPVLAPFVEKLYRDTLKKKCGEIQE